MNKIVKKVTHRELISKPLLDNKEKLVLINSYNKDIFFGYEGFEKPDDMDDNIVVRDTLAKKLSSVNKNLKKKFPHYTLKVSYGYRSPKIQKEYFEKVKKDILSSGKKFLNEGDLFEEIHKFIAVPETAGHPAGAAVDLTIFDTRLKSNLDMGSKIDDLSDKQKLSWFAKGLTDTQKKNRKLLLDLMLQEGFAPFWGEWWHYSYGDLEWAAYYDEKNAFFGEVQNI